MPSASQTIVGVTPLSADRDSRACRIAASCARFGYRSVLLEGVPSAEGFALDGVEIVSLRRRAPGRGLGPLRAPLRFLGDFVLRPALRMPRADLVYLHAFYQYPGVRLRHLSRRVPIVYDAHDFYISLASHLRQPWLQRTIESRTERALVRRAAAVVVVSEGVAELYERAYGVRPEVLMNSHDARLDEKAPRALRDAAGARPDDVLVAVVGQWKLEHPVDTIVRALARASDRVRVAFVGAGFTPERQQVAARAGVADRVAFVGAVTPLEVVPFIAGADVATVLYRPQNESVRQCLPNGLFQGLAAGLPVVFAADLPMVAEIVQSAGLPVDADAPTSIAEAFDLLAGDESLRARLADAATARAHQVAWENEERRLATLLEQVLSSEPSRDDAEDGNRAA